MSFLPLVDNCNFWIWEKRLPSMLGHRRLPSAGLLMAKLNKRLTRALFLVVVLFLVLRLVSQRFGQLQVMPGSARWPFLNTRRAEQQTPVYPFETTSNFYPVADDDADNRTIEELCASFPKYLLQRIQPILKMGHGEARSQIDAQLKTVSGCFDSDELLLFSDLDEVILGHHAIDILANLPELYHHDNPDFKPYDALRQMLGRAGVFDATIDPTAGKHGWKLDKYKFLAEVERAWLMRPGRDWYVFYETDTYILWDNMFRFLSTLDPSAPLYIGSPSPGREGTWFANGGPGFVLSRGALEKLLSRSSSSSSSPSKSSNGRLDGAPPLTLRGLEMLKGDCCGDSVLGWMLWEAGVPISGFFPLFNTYPAHRIPFTERSWCQPVLTMHKSTPQDMLDLWRWEHCSRKLGVSKHFEFPQLGGPR